MSKIKFISVEDDGWSQFDGWSVFTSPIDRELKLAQRRVVNFLESSCGAKTEIPPAVPTTHPTCGAGSATGTSATVATATMAAADLAHGTEDSIGVDGD